MIILYDVGIKTDRRAKGGSVGGRRRAKAVEDGQQKNR